jgi:cathepsin A (carboxypeptidase C)
MTLFSQVTRAFLGQGDSMRNSAALLPELLEHGVRILAYSGNADFMCNFMVTLPAVHLIFR